MLRAALALFTCGASELVGPIYRSMKRDREHSNFVRHIERKHPTSNSSFTRGIVAVSTIGLSEVARATYQHNRRTGFGGVVYPRGRGGEKIRCKCGNRFYLKTNYNTTCYNCGVVYG